MVKRANLLKEAERRFRIRVKVKIPTNGLGLRDREVWAWLREHVGEKNYAVTPELWLPFGDAFAVHMDDPEKAAAFAAWYDANICEPAVVQPK